ncbi:hypothetical protein [Kitasatospora azatica]|uniref:hypothetical protein n=1 Tax=Kitasatospora azatica TaxID=58347 RepID=UPI001E3F221D|nr:hypothetical protein [Kitasatospora azatica]
MSRGVRTPGRLWDEADLADRRLAGVALNPAAPVEVLLRLLAVGAPAVRMVLCRDRDLPDAVVDAAVAHPDPRTRSFLAGNPHVDPARRTRLLDDPEWLVRAHLAGGPAAAEVPWPRPLPDWAVVRMITTYEDDLLGALYRQISMEFRRAMPTHPVAKVREFGSGPWDALSTGVRAALLADPDPQVRAAAARHQRLHDPALVEQDLPEQSCHARTHLLIHGALSRAVVARVLSAPGGDEGRRMIAGNPSLPADVVVLLARDPDPEVRERIACRGDLGAAERRTLAVDPDPAVRLAISLHPALTEQERAAIDYQVDQTGTFDYSPEPFHPRDPETVRRRALSAHPVLRRGAARDHGLPPDLLARLAEDEDLGVRVLLAQNHPDAPAPLLLRSFLEYTGHRREHLTTRPNFPTHGLAAFADHQDPAVRRLAARDPDLAPATADRLTRDPDPQVRAAFAAHPRLPQPRLLELLDDEELAHAAAANPALPVGLMHSLLDAGTH